MAEPNNSTPADDGTGVCGDSNMPPESSTATLLERLPSGDLDGSAVDADDLDPTEDPRPGPEGKTRTTKFSDLANKAIGSGESSLVTIYGPNLGKKYVLDQDELTIGRDEANFICAELDNVSRKHCRLAQRDAKFFVRDLNSTNGTYVNDEEIRPPTERQLRSGDLLKVGGAIYKFLSGGNVEALYHEEIYRMTIVDGLTAVYNKRYFLEFLEREMARCSRYGRPLSMMMFDIDFFKKINDEFGHLAGDYVLREIAGQVRSKVRREECFARYGGEEFAIVLPESTGGMAGKFAVKLNKLIAEHEFTFEARKLPVTVSIGVSEMTSETTSPSRFINVVDQQLYTAKRTGRNRVVTWDPETRAIQRAIGGEALVSRQLAREGPGALVAFEVGEERTVIEAFGSSRWDQLVNDLETDVGAELPGSAVLGRWRDRYVLAGLASEHSPEELVSRVRGRFALRRHEPASEPPGPQPPRLVRAAHLDATELTRERDRALDRVVVALLDADREVPGVVEQLPHPIAVRHALVATRENAAARLKGQFDAVEGTLIFLAAAGLATVRERGTAMDRQALGARLGSFAGRPLSFGAWDALCAQLAPLVANTGEAPVATVFRALFDGDGRSDLGLRIHSVVVERNATEHSVGLAEEESARRSERIDPIRCELLAACAPLAKLPLVSMVGIVSIESLDDDVDAYRYSLRSHQGAAEHFPVREEVLRAKLTKDWCYLLSDSAPPLLLSPIVAARTCETCARPELFLARGLMLGPDGATTKAVGVTSSHETKTMIAWNASARSLYSTD